MSEESTEKKKVDRQSAEASEANTKSSDQPPESDSKKSHAGRKKRGFLGSRDKHLSKKELKELQKGLEEARARVQQLEKELAEKSAKADENYDNYLRLHAETENYKKRMQREVAESIRYATESLIIDILPALNNFETALIAAEKVPETKNFAIGMEMILKQLMDVLKSKGVEQIVPENENFDPSIHNAVERVETHDYPEDHVVEVVQKGYKLHDRVVQPASVKVAVASAGSTRQDEPEAPKEGNSVKVPIEDLDELNKDEDNNEK
jgi:molecular chaperone GrpE